MIRYQFLEENSKCYFVLLYKTCHKEQASMQPYSEPTLALYSPLSDFPPFSIL